MLNNFDEYGINASISTNGLTGERQPEIVRMLAEDGQDVLGHGRANDVCAKDAKPEEAWASISRRSSGPRLA